MGQDNCKGMVREFIRENFLFGKPNGLQDDVSFMENHVLDSTGILELVTFLESTWQIKIQDNEMLPENLDSIDKVARFIARKLPAQE